MTNAPILFCHYGNSPYLEYTLRCARISNPDKEIYLLGDEANSSVATRCGVTHLRFDDFSHGPEIATFDSVYRLVQGAEHRHLKGGRDWVNFVFKRWFFTYNFLMVRGITSFWHFDTDTMIVAPLHKHEGRLSAYDCTEQCNGNCMNGFISGPQIVHRYLCKINELFQREEFLAAQQCEFDTVAKNFAFTEMRAYKMLVHEEKINAVRLNTVFDGCSFDDCICQPHGMEMEQLEPGKKIKKILLRPQGGFFSRSAQDGSLVKMESLNLSWVPLHFFASVLKHASGQVRLAEYGHDLTLGSIKKPLMPILRETVSRRNAQFLRLLRRR